jgi:hypothetical protein
MAFSKTFTHQWGDANIDNQYKKPISIEKEIK